MIKKTEGFPGGASGKECTCQCRRGKRCGFHPWVGKFPWRRKWRSSPVFLPGESHGQRSQVGYSPWGCRVGSDWSNWAHTHCNIVHCVVYDSRFQTEYFPLQVALVPYQKCCCKDNHMYRYEYWTWVLQSPLDSSQFSKSLTHTHTHTHTHIHTFPKGKGINKDWSCHFRKEIPHSSSLSATRSERRPILAFPRLLVKIF